MSRYVRFQLNLSNDLINEDNFTGLSDDFVKRGDYYYYTKPLDNKDKVATFKNFKVPTSLDNEDKEDIEITKVVDAIQSKNFTPDFSRRKSLG